MTQSASALEQGWRGYGRLPLQAEQMQNPRVTSGRIRNLATDERADLALSSHSGGIQIQGGAGRTADQRNDACTQRLEHRLYSPRDSQFHRLRGHTQHTGNQ